MVEPQRVMINPVKQHKVNEASRKVNSYVTECSYVMELLINVRGQHRKEEHVMK